MATLSLMMASRTKEEEIKGMKKFMLIIVDEEGHEVAHFYDNINKAEDDRMCAVVSLGFSCYEFLYE